MSAWDAQRQNSPSVENRELLGVGKMAQAAMDYRVVIRGGVLEGFDPEVVTDAFATAVNIGREQAQLYFIGKPRVARKRTDLATAEKFHTVFQRIGVDSTIVEIAPVRMSGAPDLELVKTTESSAEAAEEKPTADAQPSGDDVKEAWETACAAAIKLSAGRRLRKAIEATISVGAAALLGALVWTGVAHAIS
jgi:hypothetical protein